LSAEKHTLSKITIVKKANSRVKIIKTLDKGAFTHAFPPLKTKFRWLRGLFPLMLVFRVIDNLFIMT
jgi:hypothetical protein